MKIIVAQSGAAKKCDIQSISSRLLELLGRGYAVQPLDLPPLDGPEDQLRSLACYRLLPLADMSDALLCLDANAAVLRHPRKVVWLLEGMENVAGLKASGTFTSNLLRASIFEATAIFAPMTIAKQMRASGWKAVTSLDPLLTHSHDGSSSRPRSRKRPWAPLLKAVCA